MKYRYLFMLLLLVGVPFAAHGVQPASDIDASATHRYVVERTFPPGALDNLDATAKANIIANNSKAHVRWVKSYVNADKNRTFCIYEGPDKNAVLKAAQLNGLPVDSITEIPGTLDP